MKLYNIIDLHENNKVKFQIDFLLEQESDVKLLKRLAELMFQESCVATQVDISEKSFELNKRYVTTFQIVKESEQPIV